VIDGPYDKRKFRSLLTVRGTTEGHVKAQEISWQRLRAILESARGIKPDDHSEAARKAREVGGWEEFNDMKFVGKIGIEPPKNGFRAKNILLEVITPNRKEWHEPDNAPAPQTAPATQKPAAVTTAIARPPWAR
jgi:hypothetical protein